MSSQPPAPAGPKPKPPSARRRSREFAMQGVYQWIFTGAGTSDILKNLSELEEFGKADNGFLTAELRGTINEAQGLREKLEPLADRKWDEVSPIERAILISNRAARITHSDLRFEAAAVPSVDDDEPGTLLDAERRHIERVMKYENGSVERAAVRLGVSRSTLYQKLRRFRILTKQP
jgi:N utilization substance protein B